MNTDAVTKPYLSEFFNIPDDFYVAWENNYLNNIIFYRNGLVHVLGRDIDLMPALLIYDPERGMSHTEILTPYNDGAAIANLAYCSDNSIVTLESLDNGVTLNKVSANGDKLFSLDVSDVYEFNNNTKTHKLLVGKNDEIYIVNDYYIAAVSSGGKVMYNISLGDYSYQDMQVAESGDVVVRMYDEKASRTLYKYINGDKKSFGDDVEMTGGLAMYSPTYVYGGGEYDLYYRTTDALSGYNKETKELTPIMSWSSADLNVHELSNVLIVSPELIITVTISRIDDTISLGVSTPRPDDYVPERQIINLAIATSNTYMILPAVTEFNKKNNDYIINVETYIVDQYIPDLTRLNTAIVSNNTPDIIYTGVGFPMRNYISKGLFADIYQFIDNDPDLSRSDFLESVLVSGESNGKLYLLTTQFMIHTLYGKKSNIGDIDTWTYDEYKAIENSLPEGTIMSPVLDKWSMFSAFANIDANKFIDYDKGTCNFDSPEFIDAMKSVASFDDTAIMNAMENDEYQEYYYSLYGKYKANEVYLGYPSLQGIQYFITQMLKFDNEPLSFPGYPTLYGDGGALLNNYSIAITEPSKVKDGAWEFIKYLLSDEIQANYSLNSTNFAVTKSALQAQYDYLYDAFTTYNDLYYISDATGELGQVTSPLTADDRLRNGYSELILPDGLFDTIMDTLNGIQMKSLYDQTLMEMFDAELVPFLNGETTIEEAVKILQSRASIYMSEIN